MIYTSPGSYQWKQNSKENHVHTLMAKEEPKNVGKIRKHLGFLKNEDAVLFEFNFF